MGEDKSDKLHRSVLGDITNRPGKRGFSLVFPSPNSPSKSGNLNERAAEPDSGGGGGDAFWKQVAVLVEKLKKENCGIPKCPNYVPEVHLSPVKKPGNERAGEPSSDSDDAFSNKVAVLVKKLKLERCGSAKCPKVDDDVDSSSFKGGKIIGSLGNVGSFVGNSRTGIDDSEVREPSSSELHAIDLDEGQVLANVVNMGDSTTQTCSPKFSVTHHSVIHDSAQEVKESSSSALDNTDLGKGQVLPYVVNVDDITIGTCIPKFSVTENSRICERNCCEAGKTHQSEKTRAVSDALENDGVQAAMVAEVAKERDGGKTLCVDYLTSSRSQSAVSSRLLGSLERKSFNLERCTALKGAGSCDSATGLDSIKSCSCSFCTKAAYIWSDLHYQDVKGRISVLTKSQKEASNLAQRYSCENAMSSHGPGNSGKATDLEIDLMGQWKSLFLHMESIFVDESSQLQTNFAALKDLRDDFKMNLESINGIPAYVQPCSSDASYHRII